MAACPRSGSGRRAGSRCSPLLWMADFDGSTRTFLPPSSCADNTAAAGELPAVSREAEATTGERCGALAQRKTLRW